MPITTNGSEPVPLSYVAPAYSQEWTQLAHSNHTKALAYVSLALYNDSTFLPGLMERTAPYSRNANCTTNDNLTKPVLPSTPNNMAMESVYERDTRILMWYMDDHNSPQPMFNSHVFSMCQSCCCATAVDSVWNVCRTCHDINIWRQWVLGLAWNMHPYIPSSWTSDWIQAVRQAVAGLASFVDWSVGEHQGSVASQHTTETHSSNLATHQNSDVVERIMDMIQTLLQNGVVQPNNETMVHPTPQLEEYDEYLAHLRHLAKNAVTLESCATYLMDHAELMIRIPEFMEPACVHTKMSSKKNNSEPLTPPGVPPSLVPFTKRQLLGHLTRTMLRDWFVKNAGLRFDGQDGMRIPSSARAFWFAEPCCTAKAFVQAIRLHIGTPPPKQSALNTLASLASSSSTTFTTPTKSTQTSSDGVTKSEPNSTFHNQQHKGTTQQGTVVPVRKRTPLPHDTFVANQPCTKKYRATKASSDSSSSTTSVPKQISHRYNLRTRGKSTYRRNNRLSDAMNGANDPKNE